MLHETVLIFGVYLVACGIAWILHESAHYVVHSLYAESVTFGVNRRGPYVDAIYDPDAPTFAIRVGSVAPTLLYTPFVFLGIAGYLSIYSLPQLDPVEWSLVTIPLLILTFPTGSDIQSCLEAAD
ncbi:hypothetical protein [Halorubrum sp. AJ67]|uniref:hypothetical protein n=1 Tax=Halorubrum sp. AJ67 TaxID=1173487 RepID=UPI0003DCDF68|nr:hypothetical protein [Halorubrum sp. AJ67]CDK39195.1 uncharacterized protein BN903_178 [Halorubrum sp. AJ67]